MSGLQCHECGGAVEREWNYCEHCGADLGDEAFVTENPSVLHCPDCQEEIRDPDELTVSEHSTLFSTPVVMFGCPHCGAVLGVGTWAAA